jgi:hypothetical protein
MSVGDCAVIGYGLGDAPFHGSVWAFADFALASRDLVPKLACVWFVVVCVVAVAAGFDNPEEGPAEVGLDSAGESYGDDRAGVGVFDGAKGGAEEGGEARRRLR